MIFHSVILLFFLVFCKSGWPYFNGYCYHGASSPLEWTQAEIACQGLGGNLASVSTQEENDFLEG